MIHCLNPGVGGRFGVFTTLEDTVVLGINSSCCVVVTVNASFLALVVSKLCVKLGLCGCC